MGGLRKVQWGTPCAYYQCDQLVAGENTLFGKILITNLKEWQWHGGEEVRWDVFEVEILEAQVDERDRLAKEGEEVEERQGGGGQVCSLHLVGRLNADDDVKKDQDKAEGGGDEYDAIGCCTDIVVMKNRMQERSMGQK